MQKVHLNSFREKLLRSTIIFIEEVKKTRTKPYSSRKVFFFIFKLAFVLKLTSSSFNMPNYVHHFAKSTRYADGLCRLTIYRIAPNMDRADREFLKKINSLFPFQLLKLFNLRSAFVEIFTLIEFELQELLEKKVFIMRCKSLELVFRNVKLLRQHY